MKQFILKSLIVTICIGTLMHNFLPRYEKINEYSMLDKFTGKRTLFN